MMNQGKPAQSTQQQSIRQSFRIPPFPAFPSSSRYVPIGSVDEALDRVGRSIEASDAISLIMGPPGTGKSLICQVLTHRYRDSHEVVVLGDTPINDRSALLRHLLHHLAANPADAPSGDLHLALVDRVCSPDSPASGLLIVVDEAQSLEKDVLEAIRMTTNIMRDGQPRVAAIVCGGPKLDEVLVDPSMEAFTQRVATRCYLHAMSADETRDYIRSVISQCDANPSETITDDAIAAVHHGCSGVPRLVNQLMTQSIDVAEECGQVMIDETIVDRAWAMLQQLPSPMIDEPAMQLGGSQSNGQPASSSVEFGELGSLDDGTTWSDEQASPAIDSDISVDAPSACWVDEDSNEASEMEESGLTQEAISQIIPTAPPASALFGDFEVEEEVAVRHATAVAPVSPVPNAAPARPTKTESNQQSNLEAMLHQEIVGLETNVSSATIYANCSDQSPAGYEEEQSTIEPPNQSVVDNDDEEQCIIEFTQPERSKESLSSDGEVNGPAIRFVDESSDREPEETFVAKARHDDSDMLVIEDELDFRGTEKAPLLAEDSTQEEGTPVAIDFQAMMSRMRTGS